MVSFTLGKVSKTNEKMLDCLVRNLDECVRGWFIGDFDPALHRTKEFELGSKHGKKVTPQIFTIKGFLWSNLLVSGKLISTVNSMSPVNFSAFFLTKYAKLNF